MNDATSMALVLSVEIVSLLLVSLPIIHVIDSHQRAKELKCQMVRLDIILINKNGMNGIDGIFGGISLITMLIQKSSIRFKYRLFCGLVMSIKCPNCHVEICPDCGEQLKDDEDFNEHKFCEPHFDI